MVWAWTLTHLYPLKVGADDFPATREAYLQPKDVPVRSNPHRFEVMEVGPAVSDEDDDDDDVSNSDCKSDGKPVMPWTWR